MIRYLRAKTGSIFKARLLLNEDDTVQICVNCGTTTHDDEATACEASGRSKNVPGMKCGGMLRPVTCLVCGEEGEVKMADDSVIPCHRGCKKKVVQ